MTLALFDLDNTLLSGDSDYEWGQFLVRKNLVDKKTYEEANIHFYEQYKQGELDIYEWSAFTFKPLSERSMEELATLHKDYMQDVILPMMGNKAKAIIEHHRQQKHTLIVITATNSFVTRPIAEAFGIDHLIATESKIVNGRYTTDVEGIPCFNKGKVERLKAWLESNSESLEGSYFYSDSHNDLPLLDIVDHPIAVDPDERLESEAKQRGWEITSFLEKN
ncbi:MAG: HAD family hydrolase [Cocleimonas sp.]|nr:HAD family hydrolase [Cocleimonas sp.]